MEKSVISLCDQFQIYDMVGENMLIFNEYKRLKLKNN